jgi:hypothetical protein
MVPTPPKGAPAADQMNKQMNAPDEIPKSRDAMGMAQARPGEASRRPREAGWEYFFIRIIFWKPLFLNFF